MKIKRYHHKGQVALIMVLIMTVVSAIAVSVAGRSTTETRVQQLDVESREALLTAQSGLERALAEDAAVSGTVGIPENTYEVTKTDSGTTEILAENVLPGEQLEVDLTGATTTGIRVYWNPATLNEKPSIFITLIGSDGITITDYAFDVDGTNSFTPADPGVTWATKNWSYMTPAATPVQFSAGSVSKIRITVLEKAATLGVEPVGAGFPPQSTAYRSVSEVRSGVRYGLEYEESKTGLLPYIFDYALFSSGSIQ